MIMKVNDGNDDNFDSEPADVPFDFFNKDLPGPILPGDNPLANFEWPKRLRVDTQRPINVPRSLAASPHSPGDRLRFADLRRCEN